MDVHENHFRVKKYTMLHVLLKGQRVLVETPPNYNEWKICDFIFQI
jgi:hypothetical protein